MPGRDLVALLDQLGELAHDRGRGVDRGLVALEREHVAAQEDVAVEVALERPQDRVLAARQLGGDGVVELERLAHLDAHESLASASRTRADARLPSARPPALAITTFITSPMSLGPLAPVSRDRGGDDRVELGVVELGRQVASISSASDSSCSASSGRPPSRNCAAASSRRLRSRRSTASSSSAVLGRLLQLGQHQPQRADPLLLARLHRAGHVRPDLFGNRHCSTQDSPRRATRSADRTRIPSACSSRSRTSTSSPRAAAPAGR